MENFTKSISDDYSEYNGNITESNGVLANGNKPSDEGEREIDIDSLLNRIPRSYRRKRSRQLEEAPEFVKRLNAFVEVKAGTDVIFVCQWKAFPNPQIKWYKDDEDITDSERYTKESELDGTESLTLHCATKKDEGAYKCKVENQEGVASTTGYLSVTGDIADKPLSSQPRKAKSEHVISSAPHLRTIIEQKSVEEREADAANQQGPSPLQDFIDNFRRENTWPMTGTGYDMMAKGGNTEDSRKETNDNGSNGSDTSCDSQDYERVSLDLKDSLPLPGTLDKAPSVEDIVGNEEMDSNEKVENFLQKQSNTESSNTLPKFDFSQHPSDLVDDDTTTPTPTNILDEPEFDTHTTDDNEINVTTHMRGNTRWREIEIPRVVSRVLADQLEFPWLYYFLFTTCCASLAVSLEIPVPYYVMMIAIISLISFRFIEKDS